MVRFKELAGDRCETIIVLVDHRRDRRAPRADAEYWTRATASTTFMEYEIMNRGGALFVDHMQFDEYPQLAEAREMLDGTRRRGRVSPHRSCTCSSATTGSTTSAAPTGRRKSRSAASPTTSFTESCGRSSSTSARRQPVCKTCNLDPVNRLTGVLRAHNAGEMNDFDYHVHLRLIREEDEETRKFVQIASTFEPEVRADAAARKLIPVTVL